MARQPEKEVNSRRTYNGIRNRKLSSSFESLPSLTNQSINMLVDSVIQRQGVKTKKPKLSMQEKRQIKNLLADLQDKVERLSKSSKK